MQVNGRRADDGHCRASPAVGGHHGVPVNQSEMTLNWAGKMCSVGSCVPGGDVQRDASEPPLRDRGGETVRRRHVAARAGGDQRSGAVAEGECEVGVEFGGHRRPRLVAEVEAHRRELGIGGAPRGAFSAVTRSEGRRVSAVVSPTTRRSAARVCGGGRAPRARARRGAAPSRSGSTEPCRRRPGPSST